MLPLLAPPTGPPQSIQGDSFGKPPMCSNPCLPPPTPSPSHRMRPQLSPPPAGPAGPALLTFLLSQALLANSSLPHESSCFLEGKKTVYPAPRLYHFLEHLSLCRCVAHSLISFGFLLKHCLPRKDFPETLPKMVPTLPFCHNSLPGTCQRQISKYIFTCSFVHFLSHPKA